MKLVMTFHVPSLDDYAAHVTLPINADWVEQAEHDFEIACTKARKTGKESGDWAQADFTMFGHDFSANDFFEFDVYTPPIFQLLEDWHSKGAE